MTAEPTLHIAWDSTGVDVEAAPELSDQLAAALRCPRDNDHAQQESGKLR